MHLLGTLEGNIKNGAILKEIMFSNFPVWMKDKNKQPRTTSNGNL